MKKILLLASVLLMTFVWTNLTPSTSAQEDKLAGKWVGTYNNNADTEQRSMTLKFQKTGNSYVGLWGGDELNNISFDGKNLSFTFPNSGGTASCQGKIVIDEMKGKCSFSNYNNTWDWKVEKQ